MASAIEKSQEVLTDSVKDTTLSKAANINPSRLSPFVQIAKDGAVSVRLGEYLHSARGKKQQEAIRSIQERVRSAHKIKVK